MCRFWRFANLASLHCVLTSFRPGDWQEREYPLLKKGDGYQEDLEPVPVFQQVYLPLPVAIWELVFRLPSWISRIEPLERFGAMTQLTPVDFLVILSYLSATMVIGLWVGSYVRSGSDFFLAGRSLPWWAVGMSLVATDIGGRDLIGVGGDAYRYGIVMGNLAGLAVFPQC